MGFFIFIIVKQLIRKILKEETDKLEQDNLIIDIIKKLLGNEYENFYGDPFDEEHYDVIIKFNIEKVSLWKVEEKPFSSTSWSSKFQKKYDYEGTVYIEITTLLVGNKNEDKWEKMYGYDDIPETVWEEFQDYIYGEVNKWLPSVNVDAEIYF